MADNRPTPTNIVDLILAKPFYSLPHEDKLRITAGQINGKMDVVEKVGEGNGSFHLSGYDNKMYCRTFP